MAYFNSFYAALAIVTVLYAVQLLRPLWISRFSWRTWTAITAVMVVANVWMSYMQYRAWSSDKIGKFLLPPYQSWAYFFKYAGIEFFAPYIFSGLVALIAVCTARWLNRRFGERFFYPEEYVLMGTGLFVAGHPGWLAYALLVMAVHVLWNLAATVLRKSAVRVSMRYLWLPLAFIAIIAVQLVHSAPWLKALKI